MKRLTIILATLVSFTANCAEVFYGQLALTAWTRNFEEATPNSNNDNIESLEGGITPGIGYKYSENLAFEIEYLSSMNFSVDRAGQKGKIKIEAITFAPKYTIPKRYLDERLSFFVKFRIGYAHIYGTSIFGNTGSNTSYTLGPASGADYILKKNWQAFIDIGGLWSAREIEDYDFHPWQIGTRYFF